MNVLEAPVVRDLEHFASLPAEFRRAGIQSNWADANRGGAPTDSFLEGPVFDTKGDLYLTDIPFGRIFRVDAGGVVAHRRVRWRAEGDEVPERA